MILLSVQKYPKHSWGKPQHPCIAPDHTHMLYFIRSKFGCRRRSYTYCARAIPSESLQKIFRFSNGSYGCPKFWFSIEFEFDFRLHIEPEMNVCKYRGDLY